MSAEQAPTPEDAEGATPAGAGDSSVPASWLIEFERDEAARNLTRLMGDLALLEAIKSAGFVGRDYDEFEGQLIKYGTGVLGGWCGRGLILAKVKEKYGWTLPPPPDGAFVGEAIDSVVMETVAIAIVRFRDDVLCRGVWNPRRGASLNTFFVGQCLIRFPAVYRRWLREEAGDGTVAGGSALDLELLGQLSTQMLSPEQLVLKKTEAETALQRIPDARVRVALILENDGYTQEEIAGRLGVTTKTVERMLANSRSRMRQRKGTG